MIPSLPSPLSPLSFPQKTFLTIITKTWHNTHDKTTGVWEMADSDNLKKSQCEIVVVTLEGKSSSGVCIKTADGRTVIVPLREGFNAPPGAQAEIRTDHGSMQFTSNGATTLTGLVGRLGPVTPTQNQREYFRVEPDFKIRASFDSVCWTPGMGDSISEGGIRASCSGLSISEGKELSVRIYLPNWAPIFAKGVVSRMEENGIFALEFTSLSSKDRYSLVQFIYLYQTQKQKRAA